IRPAGRDDDPNVSTARLGEDQMDLDIDLATQWVRAIAAPVVQHRDHLTQLDAAIGDADHGINLSRGITAVHAALDTYEPGTVGDVLVKTDTTMMSSVGGASGPLYGGAFRAAGKALTEPTATPRQLVDALHAATAAVIKLGAA